MTVTFNGQLSEFQAEEESVQGGHPSTTAIENDLAEVLLGLFVPWNQLSPLFQRHAPDYRVKRDGCANIWSIVEPTLSLHNRNFAKNIELLRKSREDSRIDAALRRTMHKSQDSYNRNVDEIQPANLDSDNEEAQNSLDEDFSTESLIVAYHSVPRSWYKESLIAGQRIPTLRSGTSQAPVLRLESLLPLDIFD
jgi:hypothetical protein